MKGIDFLVDDKEQVVARLTWKIQRFGRRFFLMFLCEARAEEPSIHGNCEEVLKNSKIKHGVFNCHFAFSRKDFDNF